MQNTPGFRALEAAWATVSNEAIESADEASLREMARAGSAAVGISNGFLRSARRLVLQRRQEARRRGRIESIMPAVWKIWPAAEFADCGDYFRIYPDGVPGEPQIAAAL